jgi:hypothetical protein
MGVEILECVSQATERGAGRWSIHELSATRASGLRPARHDRYEEIPRILGTDTDVGGILRVVDMSELIVEKCVAAYGPGPRRWADEYLAHGGVVDLTWRQRITCDAVVVLDIASMRYAGKTRRA